MPYNKCTCGHHLHEHDVRAKQGTAGKCDKCKCQKFNEKPKG